MEKLWPVSDKLYLLYLAKRVNRLLIISGTVHREYSIPAQHLNSAIVKMKPSSSGSKTTSYNIKNVIQQWQYYKIAIRIFILMNNILSNDLYQVKPG